MRLASLDSFHGATEIWEKRDALLEVKALLDAPDIQVGPGVTKRLRARIGDTLAKSGWAQDCRIDANFGLTVTAKRSDLALQVQTGNNSRVAYDLVKLQHLYLTHAIEAAALVLPTHQASKEIGSNIASAQRFREELNLFDRQFTVPLVLVAFE